MLWERTVPTRGGVDGRWLLVGIGFGALAISFSVRAVFSLAMPLLEAEFDRPRLFFAGVGALALVIMALTAPFAGAFIDRFGPRILISGGLVAIAIGAAIVATTGSPLLFAGAFAIVAAIGFAAVGTNVVASAIAKRFTENRGLATGIGTAGATAGQLAVVPLVAALMQMASWRWGFAALAVTSLVLAGLAFMALRTNPRAMGQRSQQPDEPLGTSAMALVRSPAFHLLFWSFLLCGFTTTGVIETHLLPYAAFCGFPPLPSATAYGILCLVNMMGMAGAGWLADRVHRPRLLGFIYIARAATFMILIGVAARAPDVELLYLFAILFGIFDYSTVPVTVSLAASHLGLRRLGFALGLISGGHALGGAAGALIGGALFDWFGRYAELWTLSLALSAFAGILILLLPDSPRESRPAREPAPAT